MRRRDPARDDLAEARGVFEWAWICVAAWILVGLAVKWCLA